MGVAEHEMRSEGGQTMLRSVGRRERANFLQLLKMEQAKQLVLITESGANYDVGKILQIMPDTFRHHLGGKTGDGEALDSSAKLNIFISYAHEDEKFKNDLVKTLKVIQREYSQLEWWDDRQMDSGDWEAQIIKEMEQADMTLLLISQDFMASDYCFNKEMQTALRKYDQHGNPLIPIIIRHTDGWNRHKIGNYKHSQRMLNHSMSGTTRIVTGAMCRRV